MTFLAFAALLAWCVVLSVSDLRHRRLPNELTGSGALAVLGYALSTTQFTAALLGAGLLALPYLVIHLLAPAAFGAGDVKLAVPLGAAAALGGGQAWILAALGAPVLTAIVGLALLGHPPHPNTRHPAPSPTARPRNVPIHTHRPGGRPRQLSGPGIERGRSHGAREEQARPDFPACA